MQPYFYYIQDYIQMPPNIMRSIGDAKFNLWHGSSSKPFFESCSKISEWFNDLDIPSYIDEDGNPMSLEVAEQAMESGHTVYELGSQNLKKHIFNELAPYIQ